MKRGEGTGKTKGGHNRVGNTNSKRGKRGKRNRQKEGGGKERGKGKGGKSRFIKGSQSPGVRSGGVKQVE